MRNLGVKVLEEFQTTTWDTVGYREHTIVAVNSQFLAKTLDEFIPKPFSYFLISAIELSHAALLSLCNLSRVVFIAIEIFDFMIFYNFLPTHNHKHMLANTPGLQHVVSNIHIQTPYVN